MKSFLEILSTIVLVVVFVLGVVSIPIYCHAEPSMDYEDTVKEKKDDLQSICPKTRMSSETSCVMCHRVEKLDGEYRWVVKEEAWRNYPNRMRVIDGDDGPHAYYLLEGIDPDDVLEVYEYCVKNGIKKVHFEIQSPGGSVVEAWRIVGIMQKFKAKHGITSETECLGMAASAGALLLLSGDYRVASPRAMIMLHELWSLSFLKLETPAGSKDDALNLSIWQNNLNEWVMEHSCMSPEEISEKIEYREWWLTGEMAKERCFVDKLLWENEPAVMKADGK